MRSRDRPRRAAAAALAVLLIAALGGGCGALRSMRTSPQRGVREFSAQVGVHDEALTLHLSSPQTPLSASTPLVLYASGDGGWFGAAVGMCRTIASSGLPTVGFSTKAFMRIEHRWARPLSVAHVAGHYQRIIDAARAQLRLSPDAPVVLPAGRAGPRWAFSSPAAVRSIPMSSAWWRSASPPTSGSTSRARATTTPRTVRQCRQPSTTIGARNRSRCIRCCRGLRRGARLSSRPREMATFQRLAHANCSGPIQQRDASSPSTRAITASAAVSRGLPRR
jgi:hypothetical protein